MLPNCSSAIKTTTINEKAKDLRKTGEALSTIGVEPEKEMKMIGHES